jgi:hypothetical protein
VLKTGAEHGLNLYQIGMILYRPGFEETPSHIENLIEKTDKLFSLYVKSSVISLCLDNKQIDPKQNSLLIEEEEETKCERKKISLLKRTTSEPRLCDIEVQSKEIVDSDIKLSKQDDELDNPYNELYFYIFENVLTEYIISLK